MFRQLDARDVHTTPGILYWRNLSSLPCRAPAYEYVACLSPATSQYSDGSLSVWPNTLVFCALFNTLHSQTYAGIGPHNGPTRERYFFYAFVATTVWCGYLFYLLFPPSSLKIICRTLHRLCSRVSISSCQVISVSEKNSFKFGANIAILSYHQRIQLGMYTRPSEPVHCLSGTCRNLGLLDSSK